MKPKHYILTLALKYIYVLFLISTGAMTLMGWSQGVDMAQGTSAPTANLMRAIMASGYIVPFMGIFKIVAGLLLAIPRTSAFGAVFTFPYAFNILLYVVFVSSAEYLYLGLFDFILSAYLLYAHFGYYKPMFQKASHLA